MRKQSQAVIYATEKENGDFMMEVKNLSRNDMTKLQKVIPGSQLIVFRDYRKKTIAFGTTLAK